MTDSSRADSGDKSQASVRCGVTLARAVASASNLLQIRKKDVSPGDWIFVKTINSTYTIRVLCNGMYEASGGWFDRKGRSPMTTRIAGCSWGGSIIQTGLIAACGLFLEFGNRLITTPIQKIIVVRSWSIN